MRHLKFILSALAILLAGALTVGFAARTVVSPQTGEVVSAGVVSVPSVLGQTADEVLFYPWSMYETLTLEPLTPLLETEGEEQAVKQMAESFSHRYFAPFSLFDADFDIVAAYSAAQYAYIGRNLELVTFLKDFPAQAGDGTPLVLSFACSALDGGADTSISYLVRPQTPQAVTEEQQKQALERIKADLRELLTTRELLNAVVGPEIKRDTAYAMFMSGQFSYVTSSGETLPTGNAMAALLADYYVLSWDRSLNAAPLLSIWGALTASSGLYGFTPEDPLDDVLASLDESGIQVQLISTPDQIIVLFTCGTIMMGVYYDIQLECYSGIGLTH